MSNQAILQINKQEQQTTHKNVQIQIQKLRKRGRRKHLTLH